VFHPLLCLNFQHVYDVMHSCDLDFRAPVSMNSARWLLSPGEGLVYGTNRGDLHVRRPGSVFHTFPINLLTRHVMKMC